LAGASWLPRGEPAKAGFVFFIAVTLVAGWRSSATALRPAAGLLLAAALLTPAGAAGKRHRLPDLTLFPAAFQDWRLELQGDRKFIRFSTVVVNQGAGPAEVIGRRDGDRMFAFQVLYPAPGHKKKREVPIGEFEFHAEHGHWHLLQVVEYRLLDGAGTVVSRGKKISFCLQDDLRVVPRLQGCPKRAFYPDCSQNPEALSLLAGISVGWGDLYVRTLNGQSLEVIGLPPGDYRLEGEADPDQLLQEETRTNNVVSIPLHLP
jgi:hypothetical protein